MVYACALRDICSLIQSASSCVQRSKSSLIKALVIPAWFKCSEEKSFSSARNLRHSSAYFGFGKSACGKDTIYKKILTDDALPLKTLVPYTTRPIRDQETDGVEYYFLTEQQLRELQQQDKVIELRSYHTIHGIWHYFTVNDHQICLTEHHYLIIGTLESYQKLQQYFGKDALVPPCVFKGRASSVRIFL